MNKLSRMMAAFLAVCASAAFGDFSSVTVPEKSYANPLTLNVTSDQTLSEALAAAGASVADLTGNVYDKVVKSGVGKVTVDTAIAAFAGDLFIEDGTWCITVNDGWGAASVTDDNSSFIAISSGATLEMGGTDSLKGLDKTIYVAGTGVGDAGAIRYTNSSTPANECGPWGRNIVLTGDATFKNGSSGSNRIGRNRQENQVTFYLNGHKFTYHGNNESTDCNAYWATSGSVEIAAGIFTLAGCDGYYSKFEGDASSSFILSGTGRLKVGNQNETYYCRPITDWTLVVRNASPITWTSSPTEGANPDACSYWPGPVQLDVDTVLTGKNGSSFSLKGKVSGDHSLTYRSSTDGKTPHLYLGSESNDFTGGVAVEDAVLHAAANGSIPASGGTLALTNAAIELADETNYSLPAVSLSGKCAFTPSAVQIVNHPATPGLYEGYNDQIGTKNEVIDDTTTLYTDSVQLSPQWANQQTTITPKDADHYGRWTYSGYLWNNSSEPVVWIFTASPRYVGVLRVGDAWVNTQNGTGSEGTSLFTTDSHKRGLVRATLQPGGNRIEYIGMMTAKNDMKTGSIGLDSEDSTLGFGKHDALMVYKQDVTLEEAKSIAKDDGWEKLVDPGDGSVFTIDLPSEFAAQTVTVPALAFGEDATLELAGWNLVTTNLSGFGAVSNETATEASPESALSVNGVWTISGTDVRAGKKLITDRAVVFGNGATVELAEPKAAVSGTDYVILTAEGGITGLPTCEGIKLSLSADGKSLVLHRDGPGLVLIFR